MNERRLVVGFGLFVLIGILVSVAIFAINSNRNVISEKYAIPSGIATGFAYDDGTIVGSNGYGLVSFNYHTGKTEQLSKNDSVNSLATITFLTGSEDKTLYVFKTISTRQGGVLSKTLGDLGLPTNRGYWWVYNTTTESFSPLPKDTLQALIAGNNIYRLSIDGDNGLVTTLDSSLAVVDRTPILRPVSFFISGENIVLSDGKGKVTTTTDGVTYSTLSLDLQIAAVEGDNVIGTNSSSQLVIVHASTGEERVFDTITTSGRPAIWEDKVYYLDRTDTKNQTPLLYLYDLNAQKRTELSIDKKIGGLSAIGDIVTVLDENTMIISTSENGYEVIGNDLAPLPSEDPIMFPINN